MISNRPGRRTWAALLLAAAAVTGCASNTAGPEEGIDAGDVSQEAPYFQVGSRLDEQVTVSGQVSEVFGQGVFRISGDEFGDDGLAVVAAEELDLREGELAQVTGTVTQSDAAAVNEALGTDLVDDDLAFDDEYLISADQVQLLVPVGSSAAGAALGSSARLLERLGEVDGYDSLLSALAATGLADMLDEAGPYTLFAPTDEAFQALSGEQLQALLSSPERLAETLRSHLVEGDYTLDELRATDGLETVGGTRLNITQEGDRVLVAGVAVGEPDVQGSNGVVYTIDRVLTP